MSKYKVCVYAISKNEEKFVDRWYESVKDADEIVVLDTGSSDKTVEKLKSHGVSVYTEVIEPWRFDVARNISLSKVPNDIDICICIDIDEVLLPGWRDALEEVWTPDTTRLRYNYNWSLDEMDNPKVSFYTDKIHSRDGYVWTHPVHEVLTYQSGTEVYKTTDAITVNHYPDTTKSREGYLSLLELSVREDPEDDRNMHYLGREYMYRARWNDAIDTLIKHLSLKKAVWRDERCASMRFIARCYKNLKRYDEAKMWLEKAINEAPYLRDPYVEMAILYYDLSDFNKVIKYCSKALKIKTHRKTYINEVFSWNETIYDLLSISYYNTKDFDKALENVKKAVEINGSDKRLSENLKIIEESLKNS